MENRPLTVCLFFKIWNADDYLIARYRASEYLVECQAVENAPPPSSFK